MVFKYQWYKNIFGKKRLAVWNKEIRQTNYGFTYCDVDFFDIFYTAATKIE